MTFDLKRARELVWAVSERKIWTLLERTGYGGDIDKRRERQAITEICDKQFPSAIAEIERLRADNAGLSKAVIDIQEERDLAQAEFRAYHKAWEEQATRVQELEEALVEMVATNPCNIPTLCDVVHDELMCPALDGNCDFWKGCPQKNELREAARKQLHAEGKIGPDADAKPQVWQITEERKAALWHAINVLKENDIMEEPEEHLWDEEVTVLQAMMKEAGQ